jgi:hypothetical protein
VSHQQQDQVKPSEQRGGAAMHDKEAREKGLWAATAGEGIVPAELGGSDAPREMLADDPQLGSAVLGVTTGSDKPATETGIDRGGGDKADAVTDGGPDLPRGAEPDLKDIAAAAIRQSQAGPGPGESDGPNGREPGDVAEGESGASHVDQARPSTVRRPKRQPDA